ncbi:calcineurin-like phosphoesterase family protein [Ilumatobacter fluminis]|uniref:Calcineurin-like phosphoesterase family protein n=1 Tax=Ilumatobacter fluminis TaxID=467091 RepID=A0A4R7HVR7_9ACTN|nr:metallophosphoesterase [Ilumatobacter fluminis]TDT14609.1 calcineurin-like phosphoesterase family protein [Ilumatobacter fluminis]
MNDDAGSSFEGPGYDIVGDVHGHVEQLEKLLTKLGYTEGKDGVYRHPTRQVVFVGDLIDYKRDDQLATLRVVKAMHDAGTAVVVLGNHEFNAVAYATPNPVRLDYCRPHTVKNTKQHREFLEEVGFGSPLHHTIIDWFRSLPLWWELDGRLRVVHACWSESDIEHLRSVLDDGRTLNEFVIREGSTKETPTYKAIENVLKGPEVEMADHHYMDKGGHRRDKARVKWWKAKATTLDKLAMVPERTQLFDKKGRKVKRLPADPVKAAVPRYTGTVPVVVGHYWNSGRPKTLNDRVACVDYSAGKGGPLAAYRWCGEEVLVDDHFVTT